MIPHRGRARIAYGAVLAFALALASPSPLIAQSSPTEVDRILAAVVGVFARIPDDARTASVLGTERAGSGVVIDSNGLVLTIGYVVLEASQTLLRVNGQDPIPARVLGYDPDSGLALLRALEPLAVQPMKLGESSSVGIRDPVLIASAGMTPALSPAFVVSRSPFAGYWEYLLDRPLIVSPPHPTFAGAALMSAQGELLGIGSLSLGQVSFEDLLLPGNLFVPIDELKPILADLIVNGRPSGPARPWLGIYADETDGRVVVVRVAEDGPAANAGLATGDLLVSVAGVPVASLIELYRAVWAQGEAGVEVPLGIMRDAEHLHLTLTSMDRHDWYRISPALR